ncbi:hypothetical protein BJF79_13555 [Actinomadura sp. CNU-125]|uniref:hypothetical protein n=1 Tax=Actinomadura sp. CNU-125 TaxID=1904961 RepID=UPI00095A76FD|nr:hypothetical protein [Actinomadura sp. CNU-125]OLT24364.1 hypothetical protein BJF79_13555 [Actinomadura sp. CNU-125]
MPESAAAREAVCKHCGKPIVFAPYWLDARLPNPHIWFHPPGATTCSTRPDGWPEDDWPHAEPEPEERDLAWFRDRIPDDLPADPVPLTAGEIGRQSIEAFIAARTDRIPEETTVPEPTEPRQDVPDDLVQIGVDAWQVSGRVFMDRATRAILAAVLPVHERRVREEAAVEILALWPPDDPEDYEFVHAVTDYLRGICHVCDKPITDEPCTPCHRRLPTASKETPRDRVWRPRRHLHPDVHGLPRSVRRHPPRRPHLVLPVPARRRVPRHRPHPRPCDRRPAR